MRVLILHDEVSEDSRPDEQDALVQAKAVADLLAGLGHCFEIRPFAPDPEVVRRLVRTTAAEVVFNLVESVGGSGRLVHWPPAVFEAVGVPYTGSHTEAMFLTSQKVLGKRFLAAGGLPTPPWHSPAWVQEGESFLPGRYIIKSVWEEASVGLDDHSVVEADDLASLGAEVARRGPQLGGEAFAEAYIEGREFNLSLLASSDGPEVLPPAEIDFVDYAPGKPRIVGYAAKWHADSFEYHHTPRRFDFPADDQPLLERLSGLAVRCWRWFGLRGYARVDFRVDAAGRPWILEINANPCLSPDAGFPAAVRQAGHTLDEAVARILADAFTPAWGEAR